MMELRSALDRDLRELESRKVLKEHRFASTTPIVGPLVAGFRRLWNSVATRWYILPVIQQQSEFNTAVVESLEHLRQVQMQVYAQVQEEGHEFRTRLDDLNARLIALDEDQVGLRHDLAELTVQIGRLNRLLEMLNASPALDERPR